MNSPSALLVERRGSILAVTLDRGPDNFIDVAMAAAIADAIEEAEADRACRAILLASNGKHFCAGAQLSPRADDLPTGDRNPLYDEVVRMFSGSVPIVAAVQGAAIGAGLGLALVADFRVAAPEARFAASFARLGFHPGFGISVTLPRVIGVQRATDLLYTGRRVTGEEAERIGLVDRLVPIDTVRSAAEAYAEEITQSAPLAVRSIRRTMRGALAEEVRVATAHEHAEQQVLRRSEDYREGVAAAAERRTPDFRGL